MEINNTLFAALPLLSMAGMLALLAYWIALRSRVRELEIKERMALIERGIVPPADVMTTAGAGGAPPSRRADRFRTLGIMLVGLGFALMLILGLAAHVPGIAMGVGGAVAVVGVAAIASAVFGSAR